MNRSRYERRAGDEGSALGAGGRRVEHHTRRVRTVFETGLAPRQVTTHVKIVFIRNLRCRLGGGQASRTPRPRGRPRFSRPRRPRAGLPPLLLRLLANRRVDRAGRPIAPSMAYFELAWFGLVWRGLLWLGFNGLGPSYSVFVAESGGLEPQALARPTPLSKRVRTPGSVPPPFSLSIASLVGTWGAFVLAVSANLGRDGRI